MDLRLLSRRTFVPASGAALTGLALPGRAFAQGDIQPPRQGERLSPDADGLHRRDAFRLIRAAAGDSSFWPDSPLRRAGPAARGRRRHLPSRREVAGPPDVTVFAYHTDARGLYNTPNTPFRPRLYGWAKSDARGRYGFRTISPAPYPELNTPAHIHVSLFARDLPEYWVDDYGFAGDPLITPEQLRLLTERGGGGETLRLEQGPDGVLRGRRDFVLEHVAASGGCRVLHG